MIYNIPTKMIEAYRGRQVIVRTHLPSRLVERLTETDLPNVSFIQLLSLHGKIDMLTNWAISLPIEVVMQDPLIEFPFLYKYSKLLDNHPVRISVPVVPGICKAVKQALSLDFAIRLEGNQPEEIVIDELMEVLDLYLHRTGVSQPVEYFHGLFLSFYEHEACSMWELQEENPAQVHYVTDNGEETLPGRFAGADISGLMDDFILRHQRELLAGKWECDGCQYFDCCGGYFKWPNREFSCAGVKRVFGALSETAVELRKDVDAFAASQGELRL